MSFLDYFSKESREKRKADREKKEFQARKGNILKGFQLIKNPRDISLGEYILHALNIEKNCQWPPDNRLIIPYIQALGSQSLAYLWLAENIHLRQFYGSGELAPTQYILTWRRAAKMAIQLAERATIALGKIKSQTISYREEALASLNNIIIRALAAQRLELSQVLKLPTYISNNLEPSSGGGIILGLFGPRNILPPAMIGAFLDKKSLKPSEIKETSFDALLRDKTLGYWLSNEIEFLEDKNEISKEKEAKDIHLNYADDPPYSQQQYLKLKSQGRDAEAKEFEGPCQTLVELPSSYGLLVFASNPDGRFIDTRTYSGNIHIKGQLPLEKQHKLYIDSRFGPNIILKITQGPYGASISESSPLTILKLKIPPNKKSQSEIKLTINIDTNGLFKLKAFDLSTKTDIYITQII